MNKNLIKGRGSQINPHNRFLKQKFTNEQADFSIDNEFQAQTVYLTETAKKIVNPVTSPDIPGDYSMNPYQGCEHGCVYCYARNTHEYWGYSAGIDFEQKIIIKSNAAELLEKQLKNKNHRVSPIMLSGNTDCYQPIESKLRITRSLLQTLLNYKHPVGIITKNAAILNDIDLLEKLAELKLVKVMISITSLNTKLRIKLEPRTVTAEKRLETVRILNEHKIPCGVMIAPVIPGLNSHEIPEILKKSAQAGALTAAWSVLRLNGAVGEIFSDWIQQNFPDSANKVLNSVAEAHGGKINDSRFFTRMRGQGNQIQAISKLFKINYNKYFKNRIMPEYDLNQFHIPHSQLSLF